MGCNVSLLHFLLKKNISLEDIMEEVTERNGKLRVGDRREIDTL